MSVRSAVFFVLLCIFNSSANGAIFYEDNINFIPDMKKLESSENIQISIQLQSLDEFIFSPYGSINLVESLGAKKAPYIISAKATTIVRDASPSMLQNLISNEDFMNSAFKKAHYERIDMQNLSMCPKLKIKAIGYKKEVNIKINYNKIDDLKNSFENNKIHEYLRAFMGQDKSFFESYSYPVSAIIIDINIDEVVNIGIKTGKIVILFFEYNNNNSLVISYQFFPMEQSSIRFVPNFLFKKVSMYVINKLVPIYKNYIAICPIESQPL